MRLGEKELRKRGTHPGLGVVTLSQLLGTWAAHDLTHLHQISRIMAYQYRENVGPWSKFLACFSAAGIAHRREWRYSMQVTWEQSQ